MARHVLVTGSSSGIGRATALLLDRAGFDVFAGVRKPADGDAVRAAGSARIRPVQLDVTSADSIAAAAREVEQAAGEAGLAGLVNNAGVGALGPLEHVPLARIRGVFDVNVFGLLAVTQAFVPLLRRAGGRVVNISSVGAWISLPYMSSVNASKAAVASFNDALRMELAGTGIRVVAVEPGSIRTPASEALGAMLDRSLAELPDEGRRRYEARMRAFVDAMSAMELDGSPPEVVAEAVRRALTDRSPRTRYPAGERARALAWLGRLVPNPALDRLRERLFARSG